MNGPIRFPYLQLDPHQPSEHVMPILPLTLAANDRNLAVHGVVDTGAVVSVIPYSIGEQLGFIWEQQRIEIQLTGGLSRVPARVIIVTATVPSFAPVRLVFGWSQRNDVRILLGQTNFFRQFDVCFFRSDAAFELTRRLE